ncbi:MAG TPA: hypothetical protein VMT45_11785 [Thermoanaerobaculaceae bacterium]|nr:hypothetical protein [Thermoanaerobaculaceae bacterium]
MAKRLFYVVALVLALCWAALGVAQPTQFSLELGYQWVSVSGNESIFRTQVNEKQGLQLRSFSLTTSDTSSGTKLFDRLQVDAGTLGATSQGYFRIDTGLARAYNLRIFYRHSELYSALVDFANPLLADGVDISEHTFNHASDFVNLDLELIPGHMFTPLLQYSWMRYMGPGTTTLHTGEDEFQLNSDFRETVQEVNGGVGFHIGTFAGSVLQGWRIFDSSQTDALVYGAGAGNNTKPVLGRDINLSNYTGSSHSDGTFPMTNAYVSGTLTPGLRLVGSYVRADMKSSTEETDAGTGNLASFMLARFYSGFTRSAEASSESLNWRGDLRVEWEPLDGLQLLAGYTKRHRDQDGLATIADMYANAVTFSGADAKTINTLLTSTTAMQRDENVLELKASTRNLGPVQLWVGYADAKQDLTVTPDAAEIVVPGGQGGDFTRDVKLYSAGVTFTVSTLKLAVDWKKDDADNAIVRTDYLNQERWRARLSWTLGQFLRLVGTTEKITGENPTTGIDREATTKHWAGDLEITPVKDLIFRLGYGEYKVDSTTTIRQPQDFSLVASVYNEDGTSKDAAVSYRFGRGGFEVGLSKFENTGSMPLTVDRTFARVDFDITKAWGVLVQYETRKYEDDVLSIANFDAKWYGLFLRWRN